MVVQKSLEGLVFAEGEKEIYTLQCFKLMSQYSNWILQEQVKVSFETLSNLLEQRRGNSEIRSIFIRAHNLQE